MNRKLADKMLQELYDDRAHESTAHIIFGKLKANTTVEKPKEPTPETKKEFKYKRPESPVSTHVIITSRIGGPRDYLGH
jgi:hypothetical protein